LRDLVAEALAARLATLGGPGAATKPWMKHFGVLADLREENHRLDKIFADEFETVDSEAWK